MANKYAEHSKAKDAFNHAHHRPGWVESCGSKVRYPAKRIALDAAGNVFRRRGVSVRAYRCHHCGGWHLTKRGVTQ